MNQPENAIVVGIPLEGGDAALSFAVAEARRTHAPLHLVHVLQLPPGEAYAGVYGGAVETGEAVVAAAQKRTLELADGSVPVTSELVRSGWVVGDLVDRSDSARMVVLEHRDLRRLRRLFTGSMSNGVSSRSRCTVVTVPEGWVPVTGRAPVVTAAVQDVHEADDLLRAAFEEARERGASLVVLQAWWLANGYAGVTVDQTVRDEWEARIKVELGPVVETLGQRYPMVDVTLDIRHAPPVEALLQAAERSDLLVIGRRHHLLPFGTHLGPVSRAVLGRSTTPVLMTPEPEPVRVMVL